MSGIFSTFNTANRGLQASQINVDTTSHNIANANTEGYSRQRVELETSYPFNRPGIGQIGTGVDISLITRVRDKFLDTQIRSEKSLEGEYSAEAEMLSQVESLFMEPGESGLNSIMGKMWNAWQELSKNPDSLTLKNIVSQTSQTFTNTVNHLDKGFETLKSNISGIINEKIDSIESMITKINGLNDQISKLQGEKQKPNDLMDKRDLLLDNLSELIDFTTIEEADKTITIKSGDQVLTGPLGSTDNLMDKISHGAMVGYKNAMDEINSYQEDLNNLVKGISDAINGIHSNGGLDFFTSSDGGVITGKSIKVNFDIIKDPSNINSNSIGVEEPKALQIAMLRNNLHNIDGTDITFDNYYKNLISEVGISTNESESMLNNQETMLHQLEQRRESVSGVSMDEEIANLVKFQHSYQANSKVISTLTDMLDTIINRMGV